MPKTRYLPKVKGLSPSGRGRVSDPNCWITGPCLTTRDKYYSYLKHRSQSKYRGETHSLTWEQWQTLFTDEVWNCRGRGSKDLCLGRLNWDAGWEWSNVEIMTRNRHFAIKREYNAQQRLQSL